MFSNEGALLESSPKIPTEVVTRLRSLSHELSNSIATVMHATYLLGQATLDENSQKLVALLQSASREAARINGEFRDILREHSE
jgi:signal transduction histidine kinase